MNIIPVLPINTPTVPLIALFAMIFLIVGIVKLKDAKRIKADREDLKNLPTINAMVFESLKMDGEKNKRLVVKFLDENKNEVFGIMDTCYYTDSKSRKIENMTTEQVTYWPATEEIKSLKISGQSIEYYVHFCDKEIYDPAYRAERHDAISLFVAAACFAIGAVVMFVLNGGIG